VRKTISRVREAISPRTEDDLTSAEDDLTRAEPDPPRAIHDYALAIHDLALAVHCLIAAAHRLPPEFVCSRVQLRSCSGQGRVGDNRYGRPPGFLLRACNKTSPGRGPWADQ